MSVGAVVAGGGAVVVGFGRGRVTRVVGGCLRTLVVVVVGATVVVGDEPAVVGEDPAVVGEEPAAVAGLVVAVGLVVEEDLVVVLGFVVDEDFTDVVVAFPWAAAVVPVPPPAATAGEFEVDGDVFGAWLVEEAWLVVDPTGKESDPSPAAWSVPTEGGALVATPAIDAATTVATSTRATTSAERRPDALGLRRKTGAPRRRPRRRERTCPLPAAAKRPNAVARLTRRLTLRGWPRGANAPSMATVWLGRSSLGTSTRTGHPLTTSSSSVPGRPSGVRPALRTTSRPPIASHGHRRSTVGSSASVSVQPEGSTRRSNGAKLASGWPGSPSTTQTFGSFTLRTILGPSPQHRPPRFRMLRVDRGSWKSNHDP